MKKDRAANLQQTPLHIPDAVFALLCDILAPAEETPDSSIGMLHWNACKRASLAQIKQHKDKLG